jgi:hypothetical protein
MVFAGKPECARPLGFEWLGVVGLAISGMGLVFVKVALASAPVTPMTFVILAALLGTCALKMKKYIIPKSQRGTLSEWQAARRAQNLKEWQAIPIQHAEDIETAPENRAANVKNARAAVPLLLLFGLGLCAGGAYLGKKTYILETQGLRAPGSVVRLEESRDSDGSTYHPIVRFGAGGGMEFRDSMGSNPPVYREGEDVTVLYLAEDPEKSAVIDRGAWNWAVPGGLAAAGLVFLYACLAMMKRLRMNETR